LCFSPVFFLRNQLRILDTGIPCPLTEFLGRTCVLVYRPLGYEGNLGADAVPENPTKPAKIQQICKFEPGRFGWRRSEFRHRKGIAQLPLHFESSELRTSQTSNPLFSPRVSQCWIVLLLSCVCCAHIAWCLRGLFSSCSQAVCVVLGFGDRRVSLEARKPVPGLSGTRTSEFLAVLAHMAEEQSILRKARQQRSRAPAAKHKSGLRVTEFAPVAFPFSLQIRQQTAKGLLRVQ
jgi:hypothetical protein